MEAKGKPEEIGCSVSLSPRLAKALREKSPVMSAIEDCAMKAFRKLVLEEGVDPTKWMPVLGSIEPSEDGSCYYVNFRFEPRP